jgi:hypothetical protein
LNDFEGGDDPDKSKQMYCCGCVDGDKKHCFPYVDFTISLLRRFDSSFLFALIMLNFNLGLWILVSLSSQDYFKAYLEQDPADMAIYTSIINLPWCLKIFMGLLTDNVKIFGLKRKPYLIFFGIVQAVSMFILFQWEVSDPMNVTMLLFTANFSMAFSCVVVDAILVV